MNKPSGCHINHSRHPGVHAGGHSDYMDAGCVHQKLLWEELKLRKRLGKFCKARGFIGDMRVFFRRRKLLGRLRRRYEIPHALFIGAGHGDGAVRDTLQSPG